MPSMEFIEQSAINLALFLLLSVALSHAGRYHWAPALFAHFKLQYAVGGAILFIVLFWFQHNHWALLMLAVAIWSYIQVRLPMAHPWSFEAPQGTPTLRIMQYNKFYKTRPHNRLKKYLESNTDIDLIVMQEAEDVDIQPLRNTFSPTHPHMLPADSERPNYLFIASKHPLQNLEMRTMPDCDTKGVRFEIQPTRFTSPLVIYTLHAEMPFGKKVAALQVKELMGMAQWIAADASENIICMGDWNTTPYTHLHHDMRQISGLKYQAYGLLPQGTWMSFFRFPIFKIPIDHILFKGRLNLLNLQKGPCFHSDHNSLHAWFTLK